jgi:glutamyl-Q tRNA(Asp) synthetase
VITRFAPSPTGPLHLGHAYAAMVAHDMARAAGGRFLLRIEDIDRQRSRPEWEAAIFDDLTWLGLTWDGEPLRQSDRLPVYAAALDALWGRGLLYPCTCTRRDIAEALSAPQEGESRGPVADGPDGPVYPGTCRGQDRAGMAWATRALNPRPADMTLRLDMGVAVMHGDEPVQHPGEEDRGLGFTETGPAHAGTIFTTRDDYTRGIGDIVLARRDFGTSYHLSVVLDDAAQGVTLVTRGEDLFEATRIHRLLQRLLNLPTPVYHHHRLIRDDAGKRLAKRDDARSIASYRAAGASPQDIRRMVGLG